MVSSAPSRVSAVIGAGPAGLMAAEVLAQGGAQVSVYDAMPSAGRKFLMAGRGGLNLTHSEDIGAFLQRYGAAMPHLRSAIEAFPPAAVRAWCEGLGQDTFGQESLTETERNWLRANRPDEARFWHLLTNWQPEFLQYAL